jgi:hypothetical protein
MPCANCGGNHHHLACRKPKGFVMRAQGATAANPSAPGPAELALAVAEQVLAEINVIDIESANIVDANEETMAARQGKVAEVRKNTRDWANALEYFSDLETIAKETEKRRAGNCFEIACVAFVRLAHRGVRMLNLVQIDFGTKSHVFVVLGPIRDSLDSFGVICDPWANVCSRGGEEYKLQFGARMQMWQNEGTQLETGAGTSKPVSWELLMRAGSVTPLFTFGGANF